MALSIEGWIDGLTAIIILFSALLLGLIFIYKSIKTRAKLLFYAGIAIIFLHIGFLGVVVDFIVILFTGKNFIYATEVSIIGYFLFPIGSLFYIYIIIELMFPKKKNPIISIYILIYILFWMAILLDPIGSFNFNYPEKSGENVIDYNINPSSFLGIIMIIIIIIGLIFIGISLFKSLKLEGVLRKKYFLISLFLFIFICLGTIEGLIQLSGIALIFVRFGYLSSIFIWYFALREEPEKKEQMRPKKEVRVEGELFRITKRPAQITEEEVSISKEKKICLVCKGRVRKFNVFICDCDAFYCEKCARALIELENMCWACDAPIDESRPVKPFKKEEEIEEIEISEKPKKKPKTKK